MKNEDPITNETAQWLAATILTLASSINRQKEDTKTDSYKECEDFYNRLFGKT
jgi:hypothetical protein